MSKSSYVGLAVLALVFGLLGNFIGRAVSLGGDSFLNPASGNIPVTLSTDANGNTHVIPTNESLWGFGDSGTSLYGKSACIGGVNSQNCITGIYVATGTINAVTLGTVLQSSSTETSTITIQTSQPYLTIPVGRQCAISNTAQPTSTPSDIFGIVQSSVATSTNGTTTVFVTEQNLSSGSLAVVTGTLYAECDTYAF